MSEERVRTGGSRHSRPRKELLAWWETPSWRRFGTGSGAETTKERSLAMPSRSPTKALQPPGSGREERSSAEQGLGAPGLQPCGRRSQAGRSACGEPDRSGERFDSSWKRRRFSRGGRSPGPPAGQMRGQDGSRDCRGRRPVRAHTDPIRKVRPQRSSLSTS